MIAFSNGHSVFVVEEAVSFHRQIDGLCALVRMSLGEDPQGKSYFIFRSKSGHSARILFYDGTGYTLVTKRLSSGSFKRWPTSSTLGKKGCSMNDIHEFLWMT